MGSDGRSDGTAEKEGKKASSPLPSTSKPKLWKGALKESCPKTPMRAKTTRKVMKSVIKSKSKSMKKMMGTTASPKAKAKGSKDSTEMQAAEGNGKAAKAKAQPGPAPKPGPKPKPKVSPRAVRLRATRPIKINTTVSIRSESHHHHASLEGLVQEAYEEWDDYRNYNRSFVENGRRVRSMHFVTYLRDFLLEKGWRLYTVITMTTNKKIECWEPSNA